MTTRKLLLLLLAAVMAVPAAAQDDAETGLWSSIEVQKKLSKKVTLSGEAEFRMGDDMKNADRWTLSGALAYKPAKWVKFDAGYKFMRVHNLSETKLKDNGIDIAKWTASYWDSRHRLFASVTGNVDIGRFNLSLRERWQYTYRHSASTERYDYDDDEWEWKLKGSKAKHVLRSRLQVEYDIPKCKIDPYLSAEMYNAKGGTEKFRYTAGADWRIDKRNQLSLFYRYIDQKSDSPNQHVIGIGYRHKF